MKRWHIMGGIAAIVAVSLLGATLADFSLPLRAEESKLFPDDRILGEDGAAVTIIEYSSLTCPHCAALHKETLPRLKETWIADGRARLVYRHYPLDGLALRAAALSDCIEGERFFAFLDLLYESQRRWAEADDPLMELRRMAGLAGLGDGRAEACLIDEAAMDRVIMRAQDGRDTYGIEATPTLIVNGRKVQGAQTFEDLDAILQGTAAGG